MHATTRLTWTPDFGAAAPTHAEWMRVATVAEAILQIHLERAYDGAVSVTLRPPQPAPYAGYGLYGISPVSGDWCRLSDSYDMPIPAPTTPFARRWHRHLESVAPTTLRGLLAFVQRQALTEVAELRDLPVGVTITRADWEMLQACVRQARKGGDVLPDRCQQVIAPWGEVLDAARDDAPLRCSTCGSAGLHIHEWVRARGGAPLYGKEGPTEGVWCERCGEYD